MSFIIKNHNFINKLDQKLNIIVNKKYIYYVYESYNLL